MKKKIKLHRCACQRTYMTVELDRIQTDTIEDKKEAIDYYSCLLTNIADNYKLHRKPS